MNGTIEYEQSDDEVQDPANVDGDLSQNKGKLTDGTGVNGVSSHKVRTVLSDSSDTPPPPRDNRRDADSAMTRQRKENNDYVTQIIADAKERRAIVLELREQGLKRIPEEVLELSHLQYLYLEGNELTSLPDNFFDCLPELRWLDLRRNYLACLPSTYIGSHRNLKSLLLEGNELKTLPLEIGLIPTLSGLNICNNPLEFPPAEVIERGTQSVLQFLRDLLRAKSQGKLAPRIEDLLLDSDQESSSSDDWHRSPAGRHPSGGDMRGGLLQRQGSKDCKELVLSDSDLVGPVPTSAALHKPASYNEMKQKQIEKIKKAGALGTVEKKTKKKKSRKAMTVDMYPEPPPVDRVKERFMFDQHMYRERELNEREDVILQKRKDNEQLRQFRQEGKMRQQERYQEARIYGGAREQVDIAKKAPFGIAKEHLKIPSNEERIAQAVKESHEKMRKRRALSPRSQAKLEAERLISGLDKDIAVARDKQLEKRIKAHMLSMQDRRRAPKGNPQQEMEASKRELAIANQLQMEIESRRKQLEYRFTAFTG